MPLEKLLSDDHIWNPSPIIFSSDKEGSANAEQRKTFSSRKNSNLFRSLPMFHWGIRSTDTTTTTTTTTRYLLQKLLLNLVLRHQQVSFFPLRRGNTKPCKTGGEWVSTQCYSTSWFSKISRQNKSRCWTIICQTPKSISRDMPWRSLENRKKE